MIVERPRRRGYQLHAPDSPEAEALLSERDLTRAHLDRALAELERTEGIQIRAIVGINDDGVFGSRREGWHPVLPDACAEPFIPVLWLQVLELLGRVPKGSTATFLKDGTLPDDRPARRLREVTMDTDQLKRDMNELCHEWTHGKAPADGVGPVQAAARVFIFQALSAWTVLGATGQTEQLAPDLEAGCSRSWRTRQPANLI